MSTPYLLQCHTTTPAGLSHWFRTHADSLEDVHAVLCTLGHAVCWDALLLTRVDAPPVPSAKRLLACGGWRPADHL